MWVQSFGSGLLRFSLTNWAAFFFHKYWKNAPQFVNENRSKYSNFCSTISKKRTFFFDHFRDQPWDLYIWNFFFKIKKKTHILQFSVTNWGAWSISKQKKRCVFLKWYPKIWNILADFQWRIEVRFSNIHEKKNAPQFVNENCKRCVFFLILKKKFHIY